VSDLRQTWLVAAREIRERSRSRAFRVSLILMIVVVVGAIVVPSLLEPGTGTRDVGIVGAVPAKLAETIQSQANAVGTEARIERLSSVEEGEEALRSGDVDVLVVDGQRLEWHRRIDGQLEAVVTGAIQLVAVGERAAAAGISQEQLAAIGAPVEVDNVELGAVEGRSRAGATAAFIVTVLVFVVIATCGNLVLTGVAEEKAGRVVEVLLARMPARNLLAGKVIGIGLLGLAQVVVTAIAALIAVAFMSSNDLPAVRGAVLAWGVVWFVLGYALYAVVYGALGSLTSRTEDAQSVAGPLQVMLIAAYFVSFAAIGSPDAGWARFLSFFPPTAPLAMPNRIAMGAAEWWEPFVAAGLTIATTYALVQLAGRLYTRAILRTGPTLTLRDVWRGGLLGR
jgi:ABC-2 type transport system permease protein